MSDYDPWEDGTEYPRPMDYSQPMRPAAVLVIFASGLVLGFALVRVAEAISGIIGG